MRHRPKTPRPRPQQTSPELRDECLGFLERKFYEGRPRIFMKDRRRLLAWVVLWPAKWFNQRGVTVPADRYREIFMNVFMDGLRFGDTGNITYLPAWLAKIIQSHFSHHGEEYYDAAKLLRENDLLKGILSGKLQPMRWPVPARDPIREMAAAAALLKPKKKAPKRPVNAQLTML
jgi:hypothetical protein